jgi:peroxiredoxin
VGGTCYCDGQCAQYGDCCADYQSVCGGGSGGATGSGGSTGSGGATGSTCGSWPGGTPGVAQGKTLPQNLSWQGYADGQSSVSTVSIQDYYDCDGKKGINAVMIITGQPNCGACKSEAAGLEAKMGSWKGMGIKVVTLMIGSVSTAETWKNKYGLVSSAVLADKMPPAMAYSSSIGTPMHHIVDPRTMNVVYTQMGAGGSAFSKLEQLAQSNKK